MGDLMLACSLHETRQLVQYLLEVVVH